MIAEHSQFLIKKAPGIATGGFFDSAIMAA
jgi:hypothetical protein